MIHCEVDDRITVKDGLSCLKLHGRSGVVAEMGARILYLLTGRDGYGRHHAGYRSLPFITDYDDWMEYLRSHYVEHAVELPSPSAPPRTDNLGVAPE